MSSFNKTFGLAMLVFGLVFVSPAYAQKRVFKKRSVMKLKVKGKKLEKLRFAASIMAKKKKRKAKKFKGFSLKEI